MPAIELPRDITVEVPAPYSLPNNERPVRMHTQLFRSEWRLGEAWQLAYDRNPEAIELFAGFLGCGQGAEVDSSLALHNRSRPDVRIMASGFEANQTAVEAAHTGHYFLPRKPKFEASLANDMQALRKLGFEVSPEPVPEALGVERPEDYYEIDAEPVRAGHDVSFSQRDLRDGVTLESEADLIFIPNVLFFMEPGAATEVVLKTAGNLGRRGVLWLGDLGPATTADMRMGVSDTLWRTWLPDTATQLRGEFDLETAVTGKQDLPVGFARP